MSEQTEEKWFYADDEEKVLGIETCEYPNGAIVKRAKLSDGRIAKARRLKGKDAKMIRRLTNGDQEKYQDAVITLAATIDDKPIVLEDLESLWLDDYTMLVAMASINFSTTPKA